MRGVEGERRRGRMEARRGKRWRGWRKEGKGKGNRRGKEREGQDTDSNSGGSQHFQGHLI